MYSTLKGAKKCAKQLKSILGDSGLVYSLAKSQTAVAKAGGYSDWHDLTIHIDKQSAPPLPYDYWGRLIATLPEPCRFPVTSHLSENSTSWSPGVAESERWIRDVIPYCASLEVVHRANTALLRPGSVKGQKLRLQIVSGLLLNVEGHQDFAPKLDPETLAISLNGGPRSILPTLAQHDGFDAAIVTLETAEIVKLENGRTYVLAPSVQELRSDVIRRARNWNSQKKPETARFVVTDELAARLRLQQDLDRDEAGSKVPYDELAYRGILLQSRFSVAGEFETMMAVVDSMPPDVRRRISSIWCDSRAGCVYCVEVVLGMNQASLPGQIRECFRRATNGFNGLAVGHGSHNEVFDPEWPDFYIEDDRIIAQ
ncbi:hypothetical protein [Rhizobium bangladeshense]|uniref:hypothetical protein n=1 Tax=Rhizobium bangladeshense TaxID=1138189 RepID=UPI001C83579D|nr:hypothetical protein [Rhizobium bangladeshense]MBX4898692.1 hypothetical protein [Rhizobium bangladeshense]MBY3616715.1 hypothetical protein [Rhizobium bangladeshense]